MRASLVLVLPPALLLLSCGSDESAVLAAAARPVTVLELVERVPNSGRRATGVVEPYRATQVGFEVGGRVTFVRDVGQEIDGPQFDGDGELLLDADGEPRRVGAVIATLDDTRDRQAVAAIELKLAPNHRQLDAHQVELERVASADLESARAQAEAAKIEVDSARENVGANQAAVDLATSTVERNRGLVTSGAVSQSVVDQSEADVLTARARLQQASSAVDAAVLLDRAAAAAAQRTVDFAQELYTAGQSDFQNVLDAERSLFNAEDRLLATRGELARTYVNLQLALGSGWQSSATDADR